MARELALKTWAVKFLRSLGLEIEKRHGSPYGVKGQPDVSVCAWGLRGELELKRPGQRPTKAQLHRLESWDRAGAVAAWTDSRAGVRQFAGLLGVRAVSHDLLTPDEWRRIEDGKPSMRDWHLTERPELRLVEVEPRPRSARRPSDPAPFRSAAAAPRRGT